MMIRLPQIALGVGLAMLWLGSALAQQRGAQKPVEAPPVQNRDSTRSRFSETRTASRLPPIVTKASGTTAASSAPKGAASTKRITDAAVVVPRVEPPFDAADPRNPKEILEPTTILAIVGGYHILTGDVMGDVNLSLPPEALEAPPEMVEPARMNYLRQFLAMAIETKLLYIDFMRQDRANEIIVKVERQAVLNFNESVAAAFSKVIAADSIEAREDLRKLDPAIRRVAELMVRENLSTMGEVDLALAKYGTSLLKERKRYTERLTGYLVMQKIVGMGQGRNGGGKSNEATREQLFDYYQENLPEFERPARCQWEKLSVRHSKFDSKEAAWEAIAEMGNRVHIGGVKFSAVAKQSSQTADAEDGGFHDWTGKDSLRSAILNKAIFTLKPRELSEILEDDEGFHIVRVIERDDGGYQSFSMPETQEMIRNKIEETRMNEARKEHSAKLKREIAVWNIFDELDEEAEGADSER